MAQKKKNSFKARTCFQWHLCIHIFSLQPVNGMLHVKSIFHSRTLCFPEPMPSTVQFNPLSAKLSFQVWYPGGQRLKVISFSWSGVKSPSKCFSLIHRINNDNCITWRKTVLCRCPVEPDRCTQVRYASVTNTGSVTDGCFSSLSPALQLAWPTCSCAST